MSSCNEISSAAICKLSSNLSAQLQLVRAAEILKPTSTADCQLGCTRAALLQISASNLLAAVTQHSCTLSPPLQPFSCVLIISVQMLQCVVQQFQAKAVLMALNDVTPTRSVRVIVKGRAALCKLIRIRRGIYSCCPVL